MAFVRKFGAAAGGATEGYLLGREDVRRQAESGREDKLLAAQLDKLAREKDSYQKLGDVVERARAMQDEQRAQIGDRRPAQTNAGWTVAEEELNKLFRGAFPTPMLTQPAGNAPGLDVQQPAPPVPFIAQPRRAPRTLPNIYGDLGS